MSGERARLFFALDLPPQVRGALAAWAADVARGHDALRRVEAEMLHVTLAFLGWRTLEEGDALGGLVEECAAPVRGLAVGDAAWLPPRRPRVLAVDVEDAEASLVDLHARLVGALREAIAWEPERARYRPHVTVARVRRGARVRPFDPPPPPPARFAGAFLTLYRSRLGEAGARYAALARVAL